MLFKDRHRRVFKFHNGRRRVKIDPIRTIIDLDRDPDWDWERYLKPLQHGDPEAMRQAADAVRRNMNVPSFANGGLDDSTCIDLLEVFIRWLDKKKDSFSIFPMLPGLTDFQDESATSSTSDFTSIENEQGFESPPQYSTQ